MPLYLCQLDAFECEHWTREDAESCDAREGQALPFPRRARHSCPPRTPPPPGRAGLVEIVRRAIPESELEAQLALSILARSNK